MTDEADRSLTRQEFDAVIRRAAELAAAERDAGEGRLSEGEVYRIAHEVGLTERHVRSALDEMRGPGPGRASALDRLYGPATVRSSRVVGGTIPLLTDQINEFLVASQLLQRVRRTSDFLMYQPSLDWASQLARMASFSSREHYIASAKSVEVRFDGVDSGRTLIEFFVDPGARDEEILGAAFGGGAAGGSCGLGVGLVASLVVPPVLAVGVGVIVGLGVWVGIGLAAGRRYRERVAQVRAEVEGVLDHLEDGRSLEPPPASWRRWVKRQFHGVARDLTRPETELR